MAAAPIQELARRRLGGPGSEFPGRPLGIRELVAVAASLFCRSPIRRRFRRPGLSVPRWPQNRVGMWCNGRSGST
jgi:hypothetical protein